MEQEAELNTSYVENGFDDVREWLDKCCKRWQKAYEPSSYITVDESMIMWLGMSTARLIYLPRKPTPLGFMLKSSVCSQSCIMNMAEIVEGAEFDGNKKFCDDWQRTTATTLRLVEPYFGTGRIIFGDAWFGSL